MTDFENGLYVNEVHDCDRDGHEWEEALNLLPHVEKRFCTHCSAVKTKTTVSIDASTTSTIGDMIVALDDVELETPDLKLDGVEFNAPR